MNLNIAVSMDAVSRYCSVILERFDVATKLNGMSQVQEKVFLVIAKGVMGNPVALHAVVSLRVRFHSEECC